MRAEQGRCQEALERKGPIQLSLFETVEPEALPGGPSTDPRPLLENAEAVLATGFRDQLAKVIWTANRHTIASIVPHLPGSSRLTLRLHRCFKDAPRPVLLAVATWATGRPSNRRNALCELRGYFDQTAPQLEPSRSKPRRIQSSGRVFDLEEILGELNQRYFDGQITAQISWSLARTSARRRRRSMLLGSYCYNLGLIRIHPRLDDAAVPRFVVASVVYHEMVHAFLPHPRPTGRRVLHSDEFRLLESQFSHHLEAQAWIQKHLPKLLRTRGPI